MSQKSDQNRARRVSHYMKVRGNGSRVHDVVQAAKEIGISECQFGRAISRLIATKDPSVVNYVYATNNSPVQPTEVSATVNSFANRRRTISAMV